MQRTTIRKRVDDLVKKYGTTNPFELSEHLGINLAYDDLREGLLGYRTVMYRIPCIVLSSNNDETENTEVCGHELGHHICCHDTNVEQLKRDNLRFISYGVEYEANCFMVELLLHGVNIAEYPTKQILLDSCGVPDWAERYIDWEYLKSTADFDSFDSYY